QSPLLLHPFGTPLVSVEQELQPIVLYIFKCFKSTHKTL
ncbi:MAG: hypothetical protein ACI89R_001356, partial [Candidatus Azotimanducaceae bacterium]